MPRRGFLRAIAVCGSSILLGNASTRKVEKNFAKSNDLEDGANG
jgi:hypothetical protein